MLIFILLTFLVWLAPLSIRIKLLHHFKIKYSKTAHACDLGCRSLAHLFFTVNFISIVEPTYIFNGNNRYCLYYLIKHRSSAFYQSFSFSWIFLPPNAWCFSQIRARAFVDTTMLQLNNRRSLLQPHIIVNAFIVPLLLEP